MRSSLLVCAFGLLAACDNGQDSSSSDTEDPHGDDSSGSNLDADGDGYDRAADCDNTNAAVHPGAAEVCDRIDNNCVDGVDEGLTTPIYADHDGDTYGAGRAIDSCTTPQGYVENDDDCDDTTADVHPGGTEVCDGIDNNCVDGIDEDATTPFYADMDADTYGAGTAVDACTAPEDYVENADDCDDTTARAKPGHPEVCDRIDNDCDSDIDDDDSDVTGGSTWYPDADGDGYGAFDPRAATTACTAPSGYVSNNDDCYDSDAKRHTCRFLPP